MLTLLSDNIGMFPPLLPSGSSASSSRHLKKVLELEGTVRPSYFTDEEFSSTFKGCGVPVSGPAGQSLSSLCRPWQTCPSPSSFPVSRPGSRAGRPPPHPAEKEICSFVAQCWRAGKPSSTPDSSTEEF